MLVLRRETICRGRLPRCACGLFVALIVFVTLVRSATVQAASNGIGLKPAMGWSSWSFLRHNPTGVGVEADAKAMVTSGLARLGYRYVNVDDYWYECPGPQGPTVDSYGRWVVDPSRFPSQGAVNGIMAVADYVHRLGLKVGLYVTPGISKQAVARNTAIEGTPYHADDIATASPEKNFNCHGMIGINYSRPGAQAFIDSWADEFASWGVDYLKLDGVGPSDIADVEAWSRALIQTGRPIHLELSNSLDIKYAATWAVYSNGWRTGHDIECYCSPTDSSYPLTDWAKVAARFDQAAAWAPYGGAGAYNDYDAIEVGNGSNDGLTPAERQTQMSLWALAASPFILGADLTQLDPTDVSYLENRAVIGVDQDGIDARRIVHGITRQVFAKTERGREVVVGLFNTSWLPETISITTHALGLPSADLYEVNDLWTHRRTVTGSAIRARVPGRGVALLRVRAREGPAKRSVPSAKASVGSGPTGFGKADSWYGVTIWARVDSDRPDNVTSRRWQTLSVWVERARQLHPIRPSGPGVSVAKAAGPGG